MAIDIWECALGFMDAQILLTAEELGIFTLLEERPQTAEALARATGLPQDSATRLLTALCALGLVVKGTDGCFCNGPEASQMLVPGKPGYIGTMFHHLREDLYPLWGFFKETLVEGTAQWQRAFRGQPPPTVEMYSDPERLQAFMDGMHAISYGPALEFARAAPELSNVRTIVDVGGASGAFVIALAQVFPGLRGVVVDLPQVRPITEAYAARASLDGRITFHAADFFHDPLPQDADAYALGYILHDWSTEQGSRLLARVAEAAPSGALLIVAEYLLADDRSGPLFVARSDLNMMVAARGRERTAREYMDWIARFGFRTERVQPTHADKQFIIARKT